MAGHSAFGNDLIKHVALGNTAIKKIALGNDIVWSGASLVSYYDGSTLLGQREVDEGLDVLRPSGLTAQNLIPYPYRTTSKVEHGITWTVNADGTITANGTATANSWFDVIHNNQEYYLPVGSYKVVGCPSGGGASKYGIWVTHGSEYTQYVREFGSGGTFSITSATASETFRVVLGIQNGQTVNNLVFKPMVVDATLFPDVTYNDFVLYGMNKTGYTHVGWTGYGGTERFETKVATGEPMSLYALWLPNNLVVLTGSIIDRGGYGCNWQELTRNAKYVSGSSYAFATGWYEYNLSNSDTAYLTVNLGEYHLATIIYDSGWYAWGGSSYTSIDDITIGQDATQTKTYSANKTIKLYASGSHDRQQHHSVVVGASRVTLSNPTKWA